MQSRIGMIVPVASVSTDGMSTLQNLYLTKFTHQWHSNFATRPEKLFVGVDMNLTISLFVKSQLERRNIFTTTYYRWYYGADGNRSGLFERMNYLNPAIPKDHPNRFPKLGQDTELDILRKIYDTGMKLQSFYRPSGKKIYYHSGGRYWRKAIEKKLSSHYKECSIDSDAKDTALASLNSQLYYWYWISNSNCMDVVAREVDSFPVPRVRDGFPTLLRRLFNGYFANAEKRVREGERINTTEVNFDVKLSKPIIDEIDKVLAKHYGFSEEWLDFIPPKGEARRTGINYDIKYRMGKELEGEE